MSNKSAKFDLLSKTLLYDNVLVKSVDLSDKSSPFIDPQSYENKPEVGEVVAVGEGRIFDNGVIVPMKVAVGETVLFNKYSSTKYRFDGIDYYVLREEDIICH
jgi:chaperonin GroES